MSNDLLMGDEAPDWAADRCSLIGQVGKPKEVIGFPDNLRLISTCTKLICTDREMETVKSVSPASYVRSRRG